MDSELAFVVKHALNTLQNQTCWSVIAGAGTGSGVLLQFGKPVRRLEPLRNPTLSEFEQNHDSPLSLFVGCPWKLARGKLLLTDSTDDNDVGGQMLSSISKLKDAVVTKTAVAWPTGDAVIEFNNGFSLCVNPSHAEIEDADEGYDVFLPDWVISVDGRGRIVRQARASRPTRQST